MIETTETLELDSRLLVGRAGHCESTARNHSCNCVLPVQSWTLGFLNLHFGSCQVVCGLSPSTCDYNDLKLQDRTLANFVSGRCIENESSTSKLSSFWCPGRDLGTLWRVPGGSLKASWRVVQQATSKKRPAWLSLGSHFGPFLDPWGHLGSLMELSDLKKCHLGRAFFSDLTLDSVLDPPKCAQEASRCSLSSIFTISACLKIGQKWTPNGPFRAPKSALDFS